MLVRIELDRQYRNESYNDWTSQPHKIDDCRQSVHSMSWLIVWQQNSKLGNCRRCAGANDNKDNARLGEEEHAESDHSELSYGSRFRLMSGCSNADESQYFGTDIVKIDLRFQY